MQDLRLNGFILDLFWFYVKYFLFSSSSKLGITSVFFLDFILGRKLLKFLGRLFFLTTT